MKKNKVLILMVGLIMFSTIIVGNSISTISDLDSNNKKIMVVAGRENLIDPGPLSVVSNMNL